MLRHRRLRRRLSAPLLALLTLLLASRATGPAQAQAVGPPQRQVAVTFDDLPVVTAPRDLATQRAITRKLLDAIVRQRVPAVGFVNEEKLEDDDRLNPGRVALLREWLRAGLELGNHTYAHPSFHRTPLEAFQEEVLRGERTTRRLAAEAGRPVRYFRHPFLHTGRDLQARAAFEAFLREHGYEVAPVTIDNSDWIFALAYEKAFARGDSLTMRRIADAYVPYMESRFAYFEQQSTALLGREIPQVLLLHANRLNADLFDALAERIRARGYAFITLEQALTDPAYTSADTYAGPAGISWIHRWAITQGKKGAFFHGEPATPAFVMEEAGVESE